MINIIIPTLKKPHLKECLGHLKKNTDVPYKLYLISQGKNWPEAINIGLKKSGFKNDIILMDDDIRVLPGWLNNIEKYKKIADIIGFKLIMPNGKIDHAGCIVTYDPLRWLYGKIFKKTFATFIANNVIGHGEKDNGQHDRIKFLPHVTTSLIYIKKEVFKKINGMKVWPGHHHEDWDFSFRALQNDFKIMYCPNKAIHLVTATKKKFKNFNQKAEINYQILHKTWFQNKKFIAFLKNKKFIVFKIWKIWFKKV